MKTALRTIEARLLELAENAEQNTPATRAEVEILTHDLRVVAIQVSAQAEMLERGLVGE